MCLLRRAHADDDARGWRVVGGGVTKYTTGIDIPTIRARPVAARFWEKVDLSGECWLWTGGVDAEGYGRFQIARVSRLAHRVSWELAKGPIPDGMAVLHKCDRPACVAPHHLFLGTQIDNIADCVAKGRQGRATGTRNGAYTHPERRARNGGERNGNAKLSVETISRIREMRATGMTQSKIASVVGISRSGISRILTGVSWVGA